MWHAGWPDIYGNSQGFPVLDDYKNPLVTAEYVDREKVAGRDFTGRFRPSARDDAYFDTKFVVDLSGPMTGRARGTIPRNDRVYVMSEEASSNGRQYIWLFSRDWLAAEFEKTGNVNPINGASVRPVARPGGVRFRPMIEKDVVLTRDQDARRYNERRRHEDADMQRRLEEDEQEIDRKIGNDQARLWIREQEDRRRQELREERARETQRKMDKKSREMAEQRAYILSRDYRPTKRAERERDRLRQYEEQNALVEAELDRREVEKTRQYLANFRRRRNVDDTEISEFMDRFATMTHTNQTLNDGLELIIMNSNWKSDMPEYALRKFGQHELFYPLGWKIMKAAIETRRTTLIQDLEEYNLFSLSVAQYNILAGLAERSGVYTIARIVKNMLITAF